MDQSVGSIVSSRKDKTIVLAHAHSIARDRADAFHYRLGIPVVALTALVGSSAFANVSDLGQNKLWVGITTGALAILAAVLAALQTFLDYGGKAKAHAAAANRFSALNRRIERLRRLDKDKLWDEVEEIDEALGKIIEESPSVSQKLQQQATVATASERAESTAGGFREPQGADRVEAKRPRWADASGSLIVKVALLALAGVGSLIVPLIPLLEKSRTTDWYDIFFFNPNHAYTSENSVTLHPEEERISALICRDNFFAERWDVQPTNHSFGALDKKLNDEIKGAESRVIGYSIKYRNLTLNVLEVKFKLSCRRYRA